MDNESTNNIEYGVTPSYGINNESTEKIIKVVQNEIVQVAADLSCVKKHLMLIKMRRKLGKKKTGDGRDE